MVGVYQRHAASAGSMANIASGLGEYALANGPSISQQGA